MEYIQPKNCILLIGPPAAGKSTWIYNHIARHHLGVPPYVASTDAIVDELANNYKMSYDQIWKETIGFATKVMWQELEEHADRGNAIVVDRTNMNFSSRKKFIDFLKPYGYKFEALVFPTPEKEEWERRLKSRPGKTIPKDAIKRMIETFQFPHINEGYEKVSVYEEEFNTAF